MVSWLQRLHSPLCLDRCCLAAFGLDKQFYASEARPYALVAMTTMFLFQSAKGDEERPSEWNWRWTLWSIIAVYLHLTAILVVASHWLGRFTTAFRKPIHRSRLCRIRLLELIVWSLCIAPLAGQGRQVYERASQWNGMTDAMSWIHYVELVPSLPWILVPILVLWLTNRLRHLQESDWQVLWVAVLPPGLVGFMALLQIAPLGHRRYVIGSYIATFFFGCIAMMRLRSSWHVALLGSASSLILLGSLGDWQTGNHRPFFDWPRQENWREVIRLLNEQAPADSVVYLAPNLVETATVPVADPNAFYWPGTASRSVDTYFEFAIRSHYPLRSDLRCMVLPNDTTRLEGIFGNRPSAVPALRDAEQRWNQAFVVSRSLECPWLTSKSNVSISVTSFSGAHHRNVGNLFRNDRQGDSPASSIKALACIRFRNEDHSRYSTGEYSHRTESTPIVGKAKLSDRPEATGTESHLECYANS